MQGRRELLEKEREAIREAIREGKAVHYGHRSELNKCVLAFVFEFCRIGSSTRHRRPMLGREDLSEKKVRMTMYMRASCTSV